ncbi:AEC family transporter [Marinimicrobium sp. ABcell2]|uniref:AEC family transporter n=1 Tax=Marinimicrobium sp. ABcell2 TaxID=3069751 RepID=UPI0027AFAE9A|nr:AEC family transporter [Marinimicrobium sp. ABcell2]MDQ2077272.1 AEC family transporter [Marinimicrobium sp. ABcell2]
MSSLVFIVVCLALGLALQRSRQVPANAASALNFYIIYIALPAMVLTEIPKLSLDREALLPVISTWVVMGVTAFLVWSAATWLRWSRSVTGAMMLIIPLGNTSFVGIPLIEALLGAEALPYAILYDQFGTVIALNTYGVLVAAWYSDQHAAWQKVAKTIVTFPPFVAFCIAMLAVISPWQFPEWWLTATGRIALSLAPVVMVAVGLQWQLRLERHALVPMATGLSLKLVLIPALVFGMFWLLGLDTLAAHTVVLQAAMPAMISAGILAISHGLAPRLVSSLIGYGLLLSLFTVPMWSLLLSA